MAVDLKTLIRVRDWQVDQNSRMVGERLRRLDDLKNQARTFEDEVSAEQEIARASPDEAGQAYAGYARRILHRRAEIEAATADAEAAVATAKEALAQAYRDLKTIEIAQHNRERRDAAEVERRETMALDEMALHGFRRSGRHR